MILPRFSQWLVLDSRETVVTTTSWRLDRLCDLKQSDLAGLMNGSGLCCERGVLVS